MTQLLLPIVTSFTKEVAYIFKVGLNQPTEDFPSARRAAFILLMNAAPTGQAAEVPDIPAKNPFGLSSLIIQVK